MLIKCDSRLLDTFDKANIYDLKNNMDKSNFYPSYHDTEFIVTNWDIKFS